MKKLSFIILLTAFLFGCAGETKDKTAANGEETADPQKKEATQEAEPAEELPEVAAIDTASLCEEHYHSKACRKKIEEYLLEEYKLGTRDGDILELEIENGENIRLEGNPNPSPAKFTAYRLAAYYPASGLLGVEQYFYEGMANIIVNSKTGAQIKLDANEGIAVSPDNKRFVAYSFDLEADYSPNMFTVCRIDGGQFIKEKEHDFMEGNVSGSGPKNVRWTSNNSFKVDKVTMDFGQGPKYKTLETLTFQLENGEWVQQ